MTDTTYEWAGVDALTLPHRTIDRLLPVRRGKRPGAVIFLHGVNDPGAACGTVEAGLCQGLNERLGRNDLAPGEYGLAYQAIAAHIDDHVLTQKERKIYDNPDAHLYARSEGMNTHSPFIPFYWGYRASDAEILRDPDTDEPITVRGQKQHVKGHRLDYDFAREGGVFPNATNNIPDMYGEGFRGNTLTDLLTWSGVAGKGVYIDDGPQRRYFVLAAYRLAMLIRTMRNVPSAGPTHDPARETITIIGHSQGTLVALLAQALLHQQGQRCADCLILVDSPYSVREVGPADDTPLEDVQTPYARVQTLIDIVNAVTASPFALPKLADLLVSAADYEGRTGKRWQATYGHRPAKDGDGLIRFTERDNRGKVYCYFCPEDTVVGMQGVEGIGTFGMPDTTEERWDVPHINYKSAQPLPRTRELPVMRGALDRMRFFQRMWTRLPRKDQAGKTIYLPVGASPGPVVVRTRDQRSWAGPDGLSSLPKRLFADARHTLGEALTINAEALQPEHLPEMYGNEAITGSVDAKGNDKTGKVAPDRVAVDVGLGNRYARFLWVPIETTGDPTVKPDVAAFKAGFNDKKHPDDQTAKVRVVERSLGRTKHYGLEREETPAEARARLPHDPKEFEDNNYHSAILNHTENHRWVTAMDVAIGQAVTLDDPRWRSLLMHLANWRYTKEIMNDIREHPNYDRLDDETRKLTEATGEYFRNGIFPPEDIVPLSLPSLVTSQTARERQAMGMSDTRPLRVPDQVSEEEARA